MKHFTLLFAALLILSCKTPSELLQNGNYSLAFDKATKEIKKQKNIDQNIKVIQLAAELMVKSDLKYVRYANEKGDVKDWIKTQTKLFNTLADLGETNILTRGVINDPYDELCTAKKDLDYQIVDHYYNEGHDELDYFYSNKQKQHARNAYYSLVDCKKNAGITFFPDLAEDINEAYENGIVYYTCNEYNLSNRLFVQPLPKNATFKPDCDVTIDHGFVYFSKSDAISRETKTREIVTGRKAVVDTSGHTTYIPIRETVKATIVTKKVTITAQVTTHIKSQHITDQCTVKSTSFTSEATDTYDELSVEGDTRALLHHISEKKGNVSAIEHELRQKVMRIADSDINI